MYTTIESIIDFLVQNYAPHGAFMDPKIGALMDLLQPALIVWSIFLV